MSLRQPSLVFVTEKPAVARELAPLLSERWPDREIYFILTLYFGLFEFRYPRGLSFADLPYAQDPSWKRRTSDTSHMMRFAKVIDCQVNRIDIDPKVLLSEDNEIWFACDPDYAGAIAYQVLLTEIMGEEAALVERPALVINALDLKRMKKSLENPSSTGSDQFKAWVNAGEAKRFFDFNFNINSRVLLGHCLRKVGVNTDDFAISKFALQLLYAIKDSKPIKEYKLHSMMDSWTGTGRYSEAKLGTPMSKQDIIHDLRRSGLIHSKKDKYFISEIGIAFLNQLHPDCEDLDLPSRILHWQQEWPNSKNQVARYLRTFFGKQMRYMR
jgi:DNA topoisomerase IA